MGFLSGPEFFFRIISEQDYFFRWPFWPNYYFLKIESYRYRGYRDNFMLNNGFRDNYMLNSGFHKAFATHSHSIHFLRQLKTIYFKQLLTCLQKECL